MTREDRLSWIACVVAVALVAAWLIYANRATDDCERRGGVAIYQTVQVKCVAKPEGPR